MPADEQSEKGGKRMPPFMESAIRGWFSIIEAYFSLRNISVSSTKYFHVLSALPPEIRDKDSCICPQWTVLWCPQKWIHSNPWAHKTRINLFIWSVRQKWLSDLRTIFKNKWPQQTKLVSGRIYSKASIHLSIAAIHRTNDCSTKGFNATTDGNTRWWTSTITSSKRSDI